MDLFKIEPCQLFSFIMDNQIKLPRYQRKDTWKPDQYFGLCISVFQGYPIGVFIINQTGSCSYLLDGRQRRTALQQLFYNPVTIYDWAKQFCKFDVKDTPEDVGEKYWEHVGAYLDAEITIDSKKEITTDNQDDSSNEFEDSDEDLSLSQNRVISIKNNNGLLHLLHLILMVHQKKSSNYNSWYKAFDFSDFFSNKALKYYPRTSLGRREFNPRILSDFIRESIDSILADDGEHFDKEKFISYCETSWDFLDDETICKAKFRGYVEQQWLKIESSYQAIAEVKQDLINARIGLITVDHASALDAQNIFSRVNSGGTQLTAAELLSAKPYWNEPIALQYFPKSRDFIHILYDKLKVSVADEAVKWDIPATLVARLDIGNHCFFRSKNSNTCIENVDVNEISLGFKIVSSYYAGGMSKICLDNLEKKNDKGNDTIDWTHFNELIDDFVSMITVIDNGIKGFAILSQWDTDILSILGAAPTLELLVASFLKFDKLKQPYIGTNECKQFISCVKNHFDRLIFEKAAGFWKGSGDSRMANNLKYFDTRQSKITGIDNSQWEGLIQGALEGMYNGKTTTTDSLKPLLYYEKILTSVIPKANNNSRDGFDIDHIIPQKTFENENWDSTTMNSLPNLELLPSKLNKVKKDKLFNEIDKNLLQEMSFYNGISKKEMAACKTPTDNENIVKKRRKVLEKSFIANRTNWLLE